MKFIHMDEKMILQKFTSKLEYLFLETNDRLYFTNLSYVVFYKDKRTNDIVELVPRLVDKIYYVSIENTLVKLSNVLNFAFKDSNPDYFWEMMKWNVRHLDFNPVNYYPTNMVWTNDCPTEDDEGFRLIPGYTRYKINRYGIVKRIDTSAIMQNRIGKRGHNKDISYRFISVKPDYRNKTKYESLHRLLALTFLPMPIGFETMDVCHLDNNSLNNSLENLEWNTRRENNLQTCRNYNTSFQNPILVFDKKTKEITEYFSIREMERILDLKKGRGEERVLSKGTVLYNDNRAYMLKKDFTGKWPEIIHVGRRPTNYKTRVKYTNKKTNEVIYFNSVFETSKYLGVYKGTIKWRLRREPYVWECEEYKIEVVERIHY
nr:MAG TPA: homing endonuclease [Caudoviricetes sp.]